MPANQHNSVGIFIKMALFSSLFLEDFRALLTLATAVYE